MRLLLSNLFHCLLIVVVLSFAASMSRPMFTATAAGCAELQGGPAASVGMTIPRGANLTILGVGLGMSKQDLLRTKGRPLLSEKVAEGERLTFSKGEEWIELVVTLQNGLVTDVSGSALEYRGRQILRVYDSEHAVDRVLDGHPKVVTDTSTGYRSYVGGYADLHVCLMVDYTTFSCEFEPCRSAMVVSSIELRK